MAGTVTPEGRQAVIDMAAENVRKGLAHLGSTGLPIEAVVSGIMAECARTLARDHGAEAVAVLCEGMAREWRALAARGPYALAAVQPAGRA